MKNFKCTFFLLVLLTIVTTNFINCNKVRPTCGLDEKICEFFITLAEYRMMTLVQDTSPISIIQEPAFFLPNGTVFVRDRRKCTEHRILTEEEAATIPAGDGSFKEAYLFNRTLPGPPIIIYQGQQVVVHVTNNLVNDGTTVHWHGLEQKHSPWMDGVAGVSQCPINPGETFTYRFIASNPGTHWYHSHYGTQRSMGAYGPLIILDRHQADTQKKRGGDLLPEFADEFYMMVSDWFERSSTSIAKLVQTESVSYYYGWDIPTNECFNSTKQSDGVDCGVVPFNAGVINGKGRRYDTNDELVNSAIPIEKFTVEKGKKYRFRLACASMTFAFRVSIDRHSLNVISLDGNDIKTKEVESVILSSGERYDFWIEANDPDNAGSYWIRAETLEMYQNDMPRKPNHVEAVLQYRGDSTTLAEPNSIRTECTADEPCKVLNCPFEEHKSSTNISCVNICDLENTRSGTTWQIIKPAKQEDFHEHFLNFHFTGIRGSWKTTVNGIQHRPHSAPPQIYPSKDKQNSFPCNKNNCVDQLCKCTHMLEVPLGKVVQLVLYITINNPVGLLNGNPHNVHLHGYPFQIVKAGYPMYDNETGFYQQRNPDIKCFGEFCNNATWTNSSWVNGNLPDLIESPPVKDTVFIPVGGYIVLRFKADNPGYWYMHCHTEFHNEEGMALLLKVGNEDQMTVAPKQMSQCGNTDISNEEFLNLLQTLRSSVMKNSSLPTDDEETAEHLLMIYQTATVVLASCTLVLLISNIALWINKFSKASEYIPIPSTA